MGKYFFSPRKPKNTYLSEPSLGIYGRFFDFQGKIPFFTKKKSFDFRTYLSLRLNAEVVTRVWQILVSLVVGIKIIFQVVILFLCALYETYKKKLKNVQNRSSCGSALSTA